MTSSWAVFVGLPRFFGESSEKATFEEVFSGDTADVETDFLLGVPFPATFEGLFGGDTVDVETDFPLGVTFPEWKKIVLC